MLKGLDNISYWRSVLSVLSVATVLTILELSSFFFNVCPAVRADVTHKLSNISTQFLNASDTRLTRFLDSLIGTFTLSEYNTIVSLNYILKLVSAVILISLILLTLRSAIKFSTAVNHKKSQEENVSYQKYNVMISAFLTIFLISLFQGFPCMFSKDNIMCLDRNFTKMAERWKYSNNYSKIVWDTGLCDVYDANDSTDLDMTSGIYEMATKLLYIKKKTSPELPET